LPTDSVIVDHAVYCISRAENERFHTSLQN
jgi:hypothetical protein